MYRRPGEGMQLTRWGAAFILVCLACSHAYYLPGTYPQEFFKGDTVAGSGHSYFSP